MQDQTERPKLWEGVMEMMSASTKLARQIPTHKRYALREKARRLYPVDQPDGMNRLRRRVQGVYLGILENEG